MPNCAPHATASAPSIASTPMILRPTATRQREVMATPQSAEPAPTSSPLPEVCSRSSASTSPSHVANTSSDDKRLPSSKPTARVSSSSTRNPSLPPRLDTPEKVDSGAGPVLGSLNSRASSASQVFPQVPTPPVARGDEHKPCGSTRNKKRIQRYKSDWVGPGKRLTKIKAQKPNVARPEAPPDLPARNSPRRAGLRIRGIK